MYQTKTFLSPEFGKIIVVEADGKPYFQAAECARALGYSNPRDAIRRHTKGLVKYDVPTDGGIQQINFISEGNLYRLISHSKLAIAERFESWIFDEVIPSIRKHGMYIAEQAAREAMETPEEFLARAMSVAMETLRKRDERLAALEDMNYLLAVDNKDMEIQLDRSGDYFSIKRVAAMNGIPWTDLDWRKLKAESQNLGAGIEKAFASSYGNVNAYRADVWKRVYPELVYDDSGGGRKEELMDPRRKRCDVYQIKDGARSGKPLTFTYDSKEDIRETVSRLKELNPHLDFEVVFR